MSSAPLDREHGTSGGPEPGRVAPEAALSGGSGALRWLELSLIVGGVLLAAAAVASFGWLAWKRVPFPFELDWMEGAMVEHVARLVSGNGIYVRPSMEFIAFVYNPLYYWVCAAVARVAGVGFLSLRLVSVAAAIATFGLIFEIVRREARSLIPGLLAAGLYAGTYPISGGFLDLGRVDSLAIALCLATVLVARRAETRASYLVVASLVALSFAARQNSLPLLGALWWHFARQRGFKASLWFALPCLSAISAGVALLSLATEGWYWFYAFALPLGHPLDPHALPRAAMLPLVVALAFSGLFFTTFAPSAEARRFYFVSSVALVVMGAAGIAHSGGFFNEYIPIYAALSVGYGLGLGEALQRGAGRSRWIRGLALAASVLQLACLAYDPRPYAPGPQDLEDGQRLLEEVRSQPGDVLVPAHGYLARMAGKQSFAHEMALLDLTQGPPAARGLILPIAREYESAIQNHRFGSIILDRPWVFQELTNRYYSVSRWIRVRSTHYFFSEKDADELRYVLLPKPKGAR